MGTISKRQQEHNEMISKLDIDGILDRYWGKANEFVLITCFDKTYSKRYNYTGMPLTIPYSEQYPLGKYRLKKVDAEQAFDEAEKERIKCLRRLYDIGLSEEQRTLFPSFDEICADIKDECVAFSERRKRGECVRTEWHCKHIRFRPEMIGENMFIAELIYVNKLKYCEPEKVFWKFYNRFGELYANDNNLCEELEQLTNNNCVRPYDYELREPPYNKLLPHLIYAKPTFTWHCSYTPVSVLHKEFRFRFNEQTRDWLAEHYNGWYDFLLEDLAFYSGDRLLFSQSTFEEDQIDYLEQFD